MFLRLGIFSVLMMLAVCAQAQHDSTLLQPVTVYGLPEEKYLAGAQLFTLDSTLHQQQASRHLGEILSFQLPVYFRNYGNGMLSGISLRGTAPQHVAVRWNGININSFSLGQADFSILPGVAFGDVKVHAGAGSAQFGSGAFGGSVLLQSDAKGPLVAFSQEVASYGRYFTSLKSAFAVGRLWSSTALYRVQADNDFLIKSIDRRQPHAAYWQQGVVQTFRYAVSPTKTISLVYWYNDAWKQIQPPIGNSNSNDEQADKNHRLVLNYEQAGQRAMLKATAGMVQDKIIYNQAPSTILRWIANAHYQYTFARGYNFSASTEWNHIIGKIDQYGPGEPAEDRVDVAASVQKQFNRASVSLSLRQPFITAVSAPLLPYVGAEVSIVKNEAHHVVLSANASKNFRAPTFNDRYWQDAGRTDLEPETSYAAEGGASWQHRFLKLNGRLFTQHVDQWIQWVPTGGGVYRPRNVREVRASGAEAGIVTNARMGTLLLRGNVAYQFTRSITLQSDPSDQASVGKQLIYTPLHTGSASVLATLRSWTAGVFAQYSGKRYTDASNADLYALNPFVLVDVSLEKSFVLNRHRFDACVAIKNIGDTTYQLYASRAMPGRNYALKISYQLNHKKQ